MSDLTIKQILDWCEEKSKSGHELSVHWSGGNDDGFLELNIDGEVSSEPEAEMLIEMVNAELGYHSWAGEFSAYGSASYVPEKRIFSGINTYKDYYGIKVFDYLIILPKSLDFDEISIGVDKVCFVGKNAGQEKQYTEFENKITAEIFNNNPKSFYYQFIHRSYFSQSGDNLEYNLKYEEINELNYLIILPKSLDFDEISIDDDKVCFVGKNEGQEKLYTEFENKLTSEIFKDNNSLWMIFENPLIHRSDFSQSGENLEYNLRYQGPREEENEIIIDFVKLLKCETNSILEEAEMSARDVLSIELAPGVSMEFVRVPAGEFLMGSDKGSDNEKPINKVHLDEYWIGKYPVTNKQFEAFVQATGNKMEAEKAGKSANWQHPQGPESSLNGLSEHPVVQVSWNDAKAFCEWAGVRLPSEAEWEKAARGTDGRTYPWGEGIDWSKTNYNDNKNRTTAVGQYKSGKSPFGAYDMAGNVNEWVDDWFAAYPGNTVSDWGYGTKYKVVRGGSWSSYGSDTRSAARSRLDASNSVSSVGFRCVRSN